MPNDHILNTSTRISANISDKNPYNFFFEKLKYVMRDGALYLLDFGRCVLFVQVKHGSQCHKIKNDTCIVSDSSTFGQTQKKCLCLFDMVKSDRT